MPSGGTSLNQREARAFDERTRASTLALCPVMLGIARPALLPESPFGQFLREDATARIKRMRAQAYREDFPGAPAAPPKQAPRPRQPDTPKPPKPPKTKKLRAQPARDLTVYHFVLPDGAEVESTRRDLQHRLPGLNPGSLADLVKGRLKQAKGVRCLGPVERTNG